MAWITKPSGTMRVPDREGGQPYLTAAMRQKLEAEVMPRYETTLACVLPGLHLIQHEYGWVPARAMQEWDPLESTCRHASLSIL